MTYISAQQAAQKWGISKRRVQILCADQRIKGATRIGNMWVVPDYAKKPTDARLKIVPSSKRAPVNPIKMARKSLRTISSTAYQLVYKNGVPPFETKKAVMSLFVSELLNHVLEPSSENTIESIYTLFGETIPLPLPISEHIRELFSNFLKKHPFCIDDALSWAYQYVNKLSKDNGLESTQFFTEKYMITSLVDRCNIEKGIGKILDPACGGGNFLLYAMDYLCDSSRLPLEVDFLEHVRAQLQRLYGYELDPILAVIASVNLRIKALSILQEYGYVITIDYFFSDFPNIYYSTKENLEGVLDVNSSTHFVRKVGTEQVNTLDYVLDSAKYIFTNPPFQTIKGMNKNQKVFLKTNFPLSKCDMCNSFIEFVLDALAENGVCGLVTQNSWMYLNSFEKLRVTLLEKYSIRTIIELGSNAFYDLSGEKTNVALLIAQKLCPNERTSLETYSLKHLSQTKIENLLSSRNGAEKHKVILNQFTVLQSPEARFGMLSTTLTQYLQNNCPSYGEYATPMQGTSTGDAKSLISYFWEHIGNSDWLPVSKGGGYSRWLGLNMYSVKWGEDGEFIKKTPGSAIRNAKYFDNTQLVFSDTGTAGLNVRLLLKGQIFVASGPGIRVIQGDPLAHIAFLNSRFASYYIRLLSPKLTIAAGYIAKIPVIEELLSSKILINSARTCIELKRDRLAKRPIYLEFTPLTDVGYLTTLDEQAIQWLLKDLEDEWQQLCVEKEIDRLILDSFDMKESDIKMLEIQVGCHALDIDGNCMLSINELDEAFNALLSTNCMLNKTRLDKNHLGCDGVLEYLAHKYTISPYELYLTISKNIQKFQKTLVKYKDMYLHNLILSVLRYSYEKLPEKLQKNRILKEIESRYPSLIRELDTIDDWIQHRLTSFHRSSFLETPIIHYLAKEKIVDLI